MRPARLLFALALLLSASVLLASCGREHRRREASGYDVKAERKAAAQRTRRIIMNNDGNDCIILAPTEPHAFTPEELLSRRTLPLVGSQVDSIFYCTGVFNIYTNRSRLTELREDVALGRRKFARELIENFGKDPLTILIEFCRAHGIEIFWSMRMNDTHDSSPQYAELMPQWKRDHPELLMGAPGQRFAAGGQRWSAVNYGEAAVRERVFRILEDVATRYDVDGLELDFFRHPVLFKEQMEGGHAGPENCDKMTELLARVRAMTDRVGAERRRPLLLAARVPDSVSYSLALGLDLERWLSEDLVDLLVGGGYVHLEPWENWAALGRKHGAPVYACLSGSRLVSSGRPEGEEDLPLWRGEALRAWEAGVSGIYTFNRFDPHSPLFRELGDPDLLRALPRRYRFIPGEPGHLRNWLRGGETFVIPDPRADDP